MDFRWNIFVESIPILLEGAVITAQLTVISVIIGLIIGLFGGLGRVDGFAERNLWNGRQRGRALWHAKRALFEPLCF